MCREPNLYENGEFKDEFKVIQADVAIIGGGPAGYVAAIRCSQNGLKTVLIEKNKLGGTCLNTGCIPTKTLVSTAKFISNMKKADDFGVSVSSFELCLKKLKSKKDEIVSSLVQGIGFLMKKNKIEVIEGKADIEEDGLIVIEGSCERVKYSKLILATGSSVSLLPIPGADCSDILSSDDLLDLKEIPKSLTIIGGGVIGMEFAFIYAAFGCKVSVVEFLPQILNLVDKDAASAVKRSARLNGIQIYESAKALSIETASDGNKIVTIERNGKKEYLTTEKVAIAVGRKANLKAVNLDKLNIELNDKKDGVKVNKYMQTSNPSVYAIGDITNQVMLAHAASHQGIIAAGHIIGKKDSMDPYLVPSAIFTFPEIGHIGYSEKEAKAKQMEFVTGKFPLRANSKAMAMQETDGFVKVLADKNTKVIIGATIVGAEATELLSVITNMVTCHMTIEQASKAIYAHPTVSEAIYEAILNIEDKAIHFG